MSAPTTSAAELKRVLDELTRFGSLRSVPAISLGKALCKQFGLDQAKRINELTAFGKLLALCERLNAEVSTLELQEHQISQVQSDTNRITSKVVGAGPYFDMRNWSNNWSESSTGPLSYIDMALAGRVEYPNLTEDAAAISQSLSESKQKILDSDLPPALKSRLVQRIDDVMAALQNVQVWGPEGVRDAVLLLSGEMTLAVANETDVKDQSYWRGLVEGVGRAFELTSKARRFHGDASHLYSAAEPLLKLLQ